MPTINQSALNFIQSVTEAIQQSIYKYEGDVNKFLVDDKDVVAVFGLAPLAHYDDAKRGVLILCHY